MWWERAIAICIATHNRDDEPINVGADQTMDQQSSNKTKKEKNISIDTKKT